MGSSPVHSRFEGCVGFRRRLLLAVLDGEALASLAWDEHLLACATCRALTESEEQLDELLAAWPAPRLDAATRERLVGRVAAERVLDAVLAQDVVLAPRALAARVLAAVRRRLAADDLATADLATAAGAPIDLDAALDAALEPRELQVPAGLAARTAAAVRARLADDALDALLDLDRVRAPVGLVGRVQAALLQTSPVQTSPVQTGPVQTGPVQTGPAQTGPAQTGPVQTGPVQTGPVQTGPVQTGPVRAAPSPITLVQAATRVPADAPRHATRATSAADRDVAPRRAQATSRSRLALVRVLVSTAVAAAILAFVWLAWRDDGLEDRLAPLAQGGDARAVDGGSPVDGGSTSSEASLVVDAQLDERILQDLELLEEVEVLLAGDLELLLSTMDASEEALLDLDADEAPATTEDPSKG
jgi:hypothetical protein